VPAHLKARAKGLAVCGRLLELVSKSQNLCAEVVVDQPVDVSSVPRLSAGSRIQKWPRRWETPGPPFGGEFTAERTRVHRKQRRKNDEIVCSCLQAKYFRRLTKVVDAPNVQRATGNRCGDTAGGWGGKSGARARTGKPVQHCSGTTPAWRSGGNFHIKPVLITHFQGGFSCARGGKAPPSRTALAWQRRGPVGSPMRDDLPGPVESRCRTKDPERGKPLGKKEKLEAAVRRARER
jgi:hypothetical protein